MGAGPGGSGSAGANRANQVSAGIAAGAAALSILGSIANSISAANAAQPDPAITQFYERKKAEDRQFQIMAHELNEQGRAAAAGDNDAEALRLFRRAYATAQRGSDPNSLVYYRNMHMVEARIAYRKALALYEADKLTEAGRSFQRATHFAQSAQDEELARKIGSHHQELIRVAETLPSSQRRRIKESSSHCMSVNGQLMCQ